MKRADVKPSTYIDSSKRINNEDAKFKFGDIIRTSKYKNTFAKDDVTDLQGEEIVETFNKKELQETNQKKFRVEKVIKG